jgi:hypothetical protein
MVSFAPPADLRAAPGVLVDRQRGIKMGMPAIATQASTACSQTLADGRDG